MKCPVCGMVITSSCDETIHRGPEFCVSALKKKVEELESEIDDLKAHISDLVEMF